MQQHIGRLWKLALFLVIFILLQACDSSSAPATPKPTATSSPSPTNTARPSPTVTFTPTPTRRPTATATPDRRRVNPENQHLYLLVGQYKSWQTARDYCIARGSHLVTISTATENDFIFKLTAGNTWLGATDEGQEGNWAWVTGEPWRYKNWDSGEPNNCCPPQNCGGTKCAPEHYLTYSGNGDTWNDIPLKATLPFVCEWEQAAP
jgi:hypothetical protein